MVRQFGKMLIEKKRVRFLTSLMAAVVYFSIFKEKRGWVTTQSEASASLKGCLRSDWITVGSLSD